MFTRLFGMVLVAVVITALVAASPIPASDIYHPSIIHEPATILYPSSITEPTEIVFPHTITFPREVTFPPTVIFPPTVRYPSRIAPVGPIAVREDDIPHLDPLTVQWLLGHRKRPMVPMQVLPSGLVVPLGEAPPDHELELPRLPSKK